MARRASRISDDELYRRYRRDYKLKERRMRRRGREMDSPILSKDDFKANYEAVKNDMEDFSRNMGMRKPSKQQIIDDIVSDQQYAITKRQARAYAQALESDIDDWEDDYAYGERPALTPLNIRQGKFDEPIENLFSNIQEYRERRMREGASKKEVADEVSYTFFWSR